MKNTSQIIAFIVGLLLGAGVTHFALHSDHSGHVHEDTHPIGYADSKDEVHVHSDFVVYLAGEQIDLSDDKYQTTALQTVHKHIHLHDNNDDIIHRHGHDITLGDFFGSLGFTLSDECITTDTNNIYCTDETNTLVVTVNGEILADPANYENQEEDQILVYYGNLDDEMYGRLQTEITDKACIYSGTCPERGVAPPEECGLTCEL